MYFKMFVFNEDNDFKAFEEKVNEFLQREKVDFCDIIIEVNKLQNKIVYSIFYDNNSIYEEEEE